MEKSYTSMFVNFFNIFQNKNRHPLNNESPSCTLADTSLNDIETVDMEVLHVEICLMESSNLKENQIIKNVQSQLCYQLHNEGKIPLNITLNCKNCKFYNSKVQSYIESLYLSVGQENMSYLSNLNIPTNYHFYRLNQDEAVAETMQKDGEEISAATHWILPSLEFHQLWENLFYADNIKEQLLQYIETAMIYSERQVNPHIINWNKVILLHGPPGTGKTSLCKALAQKITIRLNNKFTRGQLVEINSHSLFSKWFSESGKLVMNLFNEIRLLLQEESVLVCILIDEVESLAHTRNSCSNGSEPSDSIRVVNALLTQIDNLKRHPNVLILTTSNLTEAIDVAFVDRADIKQYIPPPNYIAIYKIYNTCITELMRTGFIEFEVVPEVSIIIQSADLKTSGYSRTCFQLLKLSNESQGLSGRTLRKIPFLAHALYGQTKPCRLSEFIKFMRLAVENEHKSCVTSLKT